MRQHHDDHRYDEFRGERRGRAHRPEGGRPGRGRVGEGPSDADPRSWGPRGGRGRRGGFGPDGMGPGGFDPESDPRGGFGPGGGRRGGPRGGFGPHDEHRGEERRGGERRGGPHRGGGRGRRDRRSRGDVRIAVLLLLAEGPQHGYQLMQTITERTSGRWTPSPGAIYPTLSQLEDEGLVLTTPEGGRKLASLTEAGRAHVEEQSASWPDPFASPDAGADEEIPDLRAALHDLAGAVREAGRSASAAQLAEVTALLAGAKRSVYRILAGESPAAQDSVATEVGAQDSGTERSGDLGSETPADAE